MKSLRKIQDMKAVKILESILFFVFLFSIPEISGQDKKEGGLLGKADMYKSKRTAIEYLSRNDIVEKYGRIGDSIWHFAELGMQEFNSSAILIRTLEDEGFTVQQEVAGIPTCFVASWGNGKPVIGILGEFDALPMISQRPLTPYQSPLIEGGPGHG